MLKPRDADAHYYLGNAYQEEAEMNGRMGDHASEAALLERAKPEWRIAADLDEGETRE